MSLLLKLLSGLSKVLWRGWETLSMIASSVPSILSSTSSSRVTSSEPTTDSAFLMSLICLLASFALMPAPEDTTAKKLVLAKQQIKAVYCPAPHRGPLITWVWFWTINWSGLQAWRQSNKKGLSRLYFLRRLRSFSVLQPMGPVRLHWVLYRVDFSLSVCLSVCLSVFSGWAVGHN